MLSAGKIKRSVFFARTGIKYRVFAVPSLKLGGGRGIMLIAEKIKRSVFFDGIMHLLSPRESFYEPSVRVLQPIGLVPTPPTSGRPIPDLT